MTASVHIVALFFGVWLAIACPGDAAAADTTVTAEPGGMAAGGDIKNNTINQTINKIDLTNLPEFVKAFTDAQNAGKELLDEAKRKRDEIASNLGNTAGCCVVCPWPKVQGNCPGSGRQTTGW